MVGSLAQTLVNFNARNCLEAAAASCGGLQQVDSAVPLGMSSAPAKAVLPVWEMPAQLGCGSAQRPILSPYDPSVSIDRAPLGGSSLEGTVPRLELRGKLVDSKLARLRAEIVEYKKKGTPQALSYVRQLEEGLALQAPWFAPEASCKNGLIHVKTCFGSCICYWGSERTGEISGSPSKDSVQLIAGSRDGGSADYAICADPLVEALSRAPFKGLSASVRQFYCEQFAWNTALAVRRPSQDYVHGPSGIGLTSCAAYRGTVDCSGVAAVTAD